MVILWFFPLLVRQNPILEQHKSIQRNCKSAVVYAIFVHHTFSILLKRLNSHLACKQCTLCIFRHSLNIAILFGEDVNRVVVGVKLSQKFYLTNGVIGRCNMHSNIYKREWGFDPQMFIKFSFYWKQDGRKGTTTNNSFNWRMMETDTPK